MQPTSSDNLGESPGGVDAIGAARAVAPDILCRSCGYELKGIAVAGACPECGAPVAASLRGDTLKAASPGYVRGLWLGVLLAEVGVPLLVLGWAALIPLGLMMAQSAKRAGTLAGRSLDHDLQVLLEVITVVVGVVGLVGWWMLTQPDPGAPGDRDLKGRRLLRVLLVIRALRGVAGLVVVLTPSIMSSPFAVFSGNIEVNSNNLANTLHNPVWLTAVTLRMVFFGLFVFQFVLECRFLSALAARIPSPRIARHARRAAWLIPLGWTVGFALCLTGPPLALGYYWWLLDQTRRSLAKLMTPTPTDGAGPIDSAA